MPAETSIEKYIEEIHGYNNPIQFFKEQPDAAYQLCMNTDEKLTATLAQVEKLKTEIEDLKQAHDSERQAWEAERRCNWHHLEGF